MRIGVRIPMLGRSYPEINQWLRAHGPEAFNNQRQSDSQRYGAPSKAQAQGMLIDREDD